MFAYFGSNVSGTIAQVIAKAVAILATPLHHGPKYQASEFSIRTLRQPRVFGDSPEPFSSVRDKHARRNFKSRDPYEVICIIFDVHDAHALPRSNMHRNACRPCAVMGNRTIPEAVLILPSAFFREFANTKAP